MCAALIRVLWTLTILLSGSAPLGPLWSTSLSPAFSCLALHISDAEELSEEENDQESEEDSADDSVDSDEESDSDDSQDDAASEEADSDSGVDDEASTDDNAEVDEGSDSSADEANADTDPDASADKSSDDADSSSADPDADSEASPSEDSESSSSDETSTTTAAIEYDCDDGYESGTWKTTWTAEKKSWCCLNEKKGCGSGRKPKKKGSAKKPSKASAHKGKATFKKGKPVPPECSMTRRQYMDLDMCQDQNIAMWAKQAGIEDKGTCHDDENGIKICSVSIECDGGQKTRTPVIEAHRSLSYDCSVCDKNGNEVLRIPCCSSCNDDVEKAKKRKFFVRKNLIDEVHCKGCDPGTLDRIGKENQDICKMTDSGFRCKMDKTCQTGEPAKVVTDRSYDCETTPCNTCKDEAARAQCCLHCLRDSCNSKGGDDKNRTVCMGCDNPPASSTASFVQMSS